MQAVVISVKTAKPHNVNDELFYRTTAPPSCILKNGNQSGEL